MLCTSDQPRGRSLKGKNAANWCSSKATVSSQLRLLWYAKFSVQVASLEAEFRSSKGENKVFGKDKKACYWH